MSLLRILRIAINSFAGPVQAGIALLRCRRTGRKSPAAYRGDPILSLRGLGKEIWQDEGADAYVKRLREGWR